MNQKKAIALLAKIERAHFRAMKAQLRYTWRPDSETGRKELERSNKWDSELYDLTVALAKIIDPNWHPNSYGHVDD